MAVTLKVDKSELQQAALSLMAEAGEPLTPIRGHHLASLFRTPAGEKVRIRTSRVHKIPFLPLSKEEGSQTAMRLRRVFGETDHTLFATPKVERSSGPVWGFKIPRDAILEQVNEHCVGRQGWSINLDDEAWARYRLDGSASASLAPVEPDPLDDLDDEDAPLPTSRTLGQVIEEARHIIAEAAGVAVSAVKIRIDLD